MGACFAATLIAVSVLPSLSVSAAAEKIYDLNVTPSSAIAGSSVDFFVKVTNRTPGNSNANSFTITAPSGFVVTAASINTATNPNPTVDVDVVSPSTVTVTGIDPMKRDQFVEVKVTATTPSIAPDCSEAQPPWTATVHTGTSLNGSTFALNNPGAAQVTTLLSCLTLAFVEGFAPADGAVGTGQTVKVEAVGASASSFTGEVTIEIVSGPTGAELSGNVATASAGVATFSNFQGDTGGDYQVRATSPGVTASDPASFTLFATVLGCENLSEEFPMEGGGTTTIEFLDPADCTTPVPFTFSYDRATNTFTIEKGELSFGLEVTVAWPSEVVPGAGEQLQIPPTEVQPPAGFAPVEWCLGTGPSLWEPPEGEDWCIFSQQAVNQGPSGGGQLMQVTDHLVLFGDANGRR